MAIIAVPGMIIGIGRPGAILPKASPDVGSQTSIATYLSPKVRLFVHSKQQVVELPLEEYVKGVVAAEMPANFELEALKAQAVVARSYVVSRMRSFGGKGSDEARGADICDSPDHAQAWLPEEALKEKWGPLEYQQMWKKVSQAVQETEGLVVMYQGKVIDPPYHSTSAGPTEDPAEVWSSSYPYLKSVPCDYCAASPYYKPQKVSFKLSDLLSKLGQGRTIPVAALRTGVSTVTTSTGRVRDIVAGTLRVSGVDLRKALGLKSTKFTVSLSGDQVTFEVRGNGHGVGMCQWGANGLAQKGLSFAEIINYYYSGVEIKHLFSE